MLVDWAGDTPEVVDAVTGEVTGVYLFAAVLPYSGAVICRRVHGHDISVLDCRPRGSTNRSYPPSRYFPAITRPSTPSRSCSNS
jgi:hypothetical protein